MKTYSYEGKEKTIEDFARMLDLFRKQSKTKGNRFGKSLNMINIADGHRVLDVGCNFGHLSILLYERGFDVTAIDVLDYQIEIANDLKRHLRIDSERLRFRCMDLLESDLEPQSFDHVVFLETIEHVENPVAFLREIRRVLRPGGYLVVSTPNALNTYYLMKQFYPNYSKLFKLIENEPGQSGTHLEHIFAWDIFTFYRLLQRSGFKYVHHEFVGLEVPLVLTIPFRIPLLSRFSRSMIFKVQKPI